MSFKEDYLPAIKRSNQAFIGIVFIWFRYALVTVGFAALTTLAKWCVSGDHVPYGNVAFDWIFIIFYTAITAIFVIQLVFFIWRNR